MYALREASPGTRVSWDYQSETGNHNDPDLAIECPCNGKACSVDLEGSLGAAIHSRACPGWIMDGNGETVPRRKPVTRAKAVKRSRS